MIGSYFWINEKEGYIVLREIILVVEGWINWIGKRLKIYFFFDGCFSSRV